MKDFEQRAQLLRQQKIITQKAYDIAVMALSDMEQRHILDDSASAFIMHLIMCIERGVQNTQLEDEQSDMKKELKACAHYDSCKQELEHLEMLTAIQWNESERTYLLMHLINLQRRA